MPAKVQIQIVTWNSRKHLERLFAGIEKQKGVDFDVVVIDNNSQDGTRGEILRLRSRAFGPLASLRMTVNQRNRGFAKAHNQGFEICESPYVLVLNPDTELQEDFLYEAVQAMEKDVRIASVGGMLYQVLPDPPSIPPLVNGGRRFEGIIDSLGLKMTIYGKILDIGQNTRQKPNFSPKTDVFGVTGACALYRLSALKQVKDEYGIFDERFGSYKEDADLAWRLRSAGFKAKIAPKAIAYHRRGTPKSDRELKSDQVKYLSLRNHLLMLKKNLSWRDVWRIKFIIGYEIAKFIYVLLFERQNLKAYSDVIASEAKQPYR